ncbi:hypothetical protein [Xanthomonas oryzae]
MGWVSGIGYRVSGIGYRVSGIGYRVSGIGYRVSGIGYRVSGIGYRVSQEHPGAWGAMQDCSTAGCPQQPEMMRVR